MRHQLSILSFFFFSIIIFVACHTHKVLPQNKNQFPSDWVGQWEGNLRISNNEGFLQEIPMQLHLTLIEDSTYTYTIIYGEDLPENHRPYLLQTIDSQKGHYVVDEQNDILLDDFLIGNKLYSRFEVMGSLLLATLEKQEGQLIYEIISGPLTPIRTTGDTIYNDEDIPPVASYKINVQQRAILQRKD